LKVHNKEELLMAESEPESSLREVVHQRVRLGVLAVLDRRGRATFTELREALAQTDGSLSRHLGVLESHGYVALEKVFVNRRPRTWVTLTEAGTRALRQEQETLAKLLAATGEHAGDTGDAERTRAITVAFAALLGTGEPDDGQADHGALVVADPAAVAAGRRLGSWPITARYEFLPGGQEFGPEQQSQRLMMMSHGLRGGWRRAWRVPRAGQPDAEPGDQDMVQCLVVELGTPEDTAAILNIMGEPTLALPDVPGARGYFLPAAEPAAVDATVPSTAVAWFAHRNYLACVTAVGAADSVRDLVRSLATEQHGHLATLTERTS
jgi:DNA-binding MarR family transcriptional regulator